MVGKEEEELDDFPETNYVASPRYIYAHERYPTIRCFPRLPPATSYPTPLQLSHNTSFEAAAAVPGTIRDPAVI